MVGSEHLQPKGLRVAGTHLFHEDLVVPDGDVLVHASKWAMIPANVDVLVTHGPPLGFGDRIQLNGEERHVGCADLLTRVRQVKPRPHLFGLRWS